MASIREIVTKKLGPGRFNSDPALQQARAEAEAAMNFAAGLTPNGLALARGANNKAWNSGVGGLPSANPEVQAMIMALAGQQDAQESAGQMAPSPLMAGNMAEVMGRMPIMGSANWGTGALSPEVEERLVSMGQPLDPAGSFASPAEAAKWARLAVLPQQTAPAMPVAPVIDGNEGMSPINPVRVAELQQLKAQQKDTFDRARKNVGLMSMAGGLARKQSLGIIPQGVDVNDLLSAMNPDFQGILTPEAVALQKQAENAAADIAMRGQVADTAARSASAVAGIEADARRENIKAVATAEANRLEVEKKRIESQNKLAEIEAKKQEARDLRDNAVSESQRKLADLQMKKAELEMKAEEKKQAEWERLAPLREKESARALKDFDRNQYAGITDPHEKATAMLTDLHEIHSGQDFNGLEFNQLPQSVLSYLRHLKANKETLVPSGGLFSTGEGSFEDEVARTLTGIGNLSPSNAARLAEQFYEGSVSESNRSGRAAPSGGGFSGGGGFF